MIEFPRLVRLLPAVLLILQGCASVSAPPEAMGAAPTDLLFGIRAIGGVNGAGWTAEAQMRQVNHVHLLNETNTGNVDVILRAALVKRGTRVSLETVSARTGETLTRGEISYLWVRSSWREVIDHLVVNYKKGTPLYEKIIAEREAAKPAVAGVTKAELQRMVTSAVAGSGPRPEAVPERPPTSAGA